MLRYSISAIPNAFMVVDFRCHHAYADDVTYGSLLGRVQNPVPKQ